MPAFLSNVLFQGGARARGLLAPVAPDEPLRKADGGGGGGAAVIERKFKTVNVTALGLKDVIELAKSAQILKIAATTGCRVRFYATAAQRDADSGRDQFTAAGEFSGLLLEVIIIETNLVVQMAPVAMVYNDEAAVTRFLPFIVEPYYAEPVDVTFTYLEIES